MGNLCDYGAGLLRLVELRIGPEVHISHISNTFRGSPYTLLNRTERISELLGFCELINLEFHLILKQLARGQNGQRYPILINYLFRLRGPLTF